MKKIILSIIMVTICSLTMSGQNVSLNRIRQEAINYYKTKLVAPSTFILTDRYGNKIPLSSVKVEKLNADTRHHTIIRYDDGKLKHYDEVSVSKPSYIVSFYSEAQCRAGGMVQSFEQVHVTNYGLPTSGRVYDVNNVFLYEEDVPLCKECSVNKAHVYGQASDHAFIDNDTLCHDCIYKEKETPRQITKIDTIQVTRETIDKIIEEYIAYQTKWHPKDDINMTKRDVINICKSYAGYKKAYLDKDELNALLDTYPAKMKKGKEIIIHVSMKHKKQKNNRDEIYYY